MKETAHAANMAVSGRNFYREGRQKLHKTTPNEQT